MESIKALREATRNITLAHQAQPNQRRSLTNQVRRGISYADIAQLEVMPTDPIQNPDGSFVFILDYDPLG